MSIDYTTYPEFVAQARAELVRANPEIDPTVYGSFTVPLLNSVSALAFTVQQSVRDLQKQFFVQTAQGEFLDLIGGYDNLPRNPSTASFGNFSIAGVVNTVIPALSTFTGANGFTYTSNNVTTVNLVTQSISSLTRNGSTVTATTADDHTLASNLNVDISGADQPEYNGTYQIAVIAKNQFTYEISTTPITPATGVISYESTYANVAVTCQTLGQTTNLESSAALTADPIITDVETTGYVQFDGLVGGANIESDESYRARILLSRSLIEGVFTRDQVKLAGLSVSGNTRVFVVGPSLSVCQTGTGVLQNVSSITRVDDTATVTTSNNHNLATGQLVTISGADQTDYNGTFNVVVTDTDTFT